MNGTVSRTDSGVEDDELKELSYCASSGTGDSITTAVRCVEKNTKKMHARTPAKKQRMENVFVFTLAAYTECEENSYI
jgi:hypothetical protein